ncbi:MAG: TonB-dependent receptor, partial [Bacteroidota bacterium]|nr:TonB-dependent receptor [Bacteroidota bacterium]
MRAQTGKINGIIKDSKSQQYLVYAEVELVETTLKTTSDSNGFYMIDYIIPGTYTIKISLKQYNPKLLYNIVVTSGNINSVNIFLDAEENVLEVANIKSKKKIFAKVIETPLSTQSLSAQEIKSFPGANFDIVKVAQSLPGVSGSVGFRNDLVIRGGAPNETVYYLDGMEVPNINHFATQGSGGGPVGMLNVAFIEEVTLSTSAFSAKYDNPLSGVLQFRQKSGNLTRTQGNFRLGASEAALTLEGPLGKSKKWSYMVSARRSYLQALFKLIKLPFLPNYWDYQYKLTFKPSKKDEINLLGLNAIDNFDFNPPKVDPYDTSIATQNNLYILNSVAKYTQYSATGGISWKHLIPRGYFNLVLSSNVLRNGITKYEDNDESVEQKLRLKVKSYEWEHKLRFDLNKFVGRWKLSTGANIGFCKYDNTFFQKTFIPFNNSYINIASDKSMNFVKFGLFGNASRSFFSNRFNLSGGIRTDMNTFTTNGLNPIKAISPRLSATYILSKQFN